MDSLLSDRRLLVVEDQMLILMMIEDMLSDLGCKSVTTAATNEQAIALIGQQNFDAAHAGHEFEWPEKSAGGRRSGHARRAFHLFHGEQFT
ncbi:MULTISPECIES: response regulator [Phyllobacterium]|jgi:response regulator RpfG family c-di-GMP phosphodiesterase|uniref:hypothetical protein n=1 Tax=Phyllobacterium TaxID=28100 RepID=UPI001CC10A44|nr:hypothetical protein [Phyllobacterium calauticae]